MDAVRISPRSRGFRGNIAPDRLLQRGEAPPTSADKDERPLMNRMERHFGTGPEAQVEYLDGDFRVRRPGAFVRCAVTGEPIPLDELRYWSVDRQEAYASPDAVLTRLQVRR
jgi:hypothetical protein